MSYMDQKMSLVKEFGTKKAQKKMNVVLTNMVRDESGVQKATHAHKDGLTQQAVEIEANRAAHNAELETDTKMKKSNFNKERVIPLSVVRLIEYKEYYAALKADHTKRDNPDQEEQEFDEQLRKICPIVLHNLRRAYRNFIERQASLQEQIEQEIEIEENAIQKLKT